MATLTGTSGNNTLTGGSGRDTLSGLGGADVLNGAGGNDSLLGGDGNDTLDGGTGNDRMEGGSGNDTYKVDSTGDVLVETGGTDTVQSSITFTLATGFEKLTLTGASTIHGTGNSASNTLTGNSAGNTLSGLGGDDTVNGGTGADSMLGGTGNDTMIVDNVGDVVLEAEVFAMPAALAAHGATPSGGIDTVRIATTGEAFAFTLPNFVEIMIGDALNNTLLIAAARKTPGSLFGGSGNDVLRGGAGGDRLDGEDGRDTVQGRDGSDSLFGGSGNDTLEGGKGHDVMDGGTGNDLLVGGSGHDTMTGGAGNDAFKYVALADGTTVAGNQTPAGAGVVPDQVEGFVSGADKVLVLKSVFDPEGTIGLGALDLGNLTVINVAYSNDNVTAGNTVSGTRAAWNAGDPSFVVDANKTLIFDPNGAASGYTVLADLGDATPAPADIVVVAS